MTLSPTKVRLLAALELLYDEQPCLAVQMPLRIEARANDHRSNHWGPRAEKAKRDRMAALLLLAGSRTRVRALLEHGLVVRVVRISPSELDSHDNLGMALKSLTDGVADALGVNDRDARVVFVPDAERGPWGARVEFYSRTPARRSTR